MSADLDPGAPASPDAFDALLAGQANFGLEPRLVLDSVAVRAADQARTRPHEIDFAIERAQAFLDACEQSHPRIGYKLGAKCASGAVPGTDFQFVDCSGFVREAIRRASDLGSRFPDGSVQQHDWIKAQGFARTTVADAKTRDGAVRIAFLSPSATSSGIGHVALVYDGATLESHGGLGPDSRPWTGGDWQASTSVYVLRGADADADHADARLLVEREGAQWFQDNAASLVVPISRFAVKPVSERAIALLLFFEVSSQAAYEQKYRAPTWPGGASGVTIGIGYDVGYVGADELAADWRGAIPDTMIAALGEAIGVKGAGAASIARALRNVVDVPWAGADTVYRNVTLPAMSTATERALPNVDGLSGDSFGALVSLTYNRGASYTAPGPRYVEMRAIRAHMEAQEYAKIPDEIRAMKRLWPDVPGLQTRREKEAQLFEDGLADRVGPHVVAAIDKIAPMLEVRGAIPVLEKLQTPLLETKPARTGGFKLKLTIRPDPEEIDVEVEVAPATD